MPTANVAKKAKRNPNEPVQIAIVGGGPKAAALAAKASVLSNSGRGVTVNVTIFESSEIGAYWSGKGGYTNGEQRLCTIAERDVGYPYRSMFDKSLDVEMASRFSWGRFLHGRSKGDRRAYSTWVDGGRKPPLHKDFADYLKWVVDESGQKVEIGKVTELAKAAPEKWRIKSEDANGNVSVHRTHFDAVVVTGPGPARSVKTRPGSGDPLPAARIFDGASFWLRHDEVKKCLARAAKEQQKLGALANPIVLIGAGGTAAAILSWLVANGAKDLPIQIVANQAALYTRVDSVFENRLFSDPTQWESLSPDSRKAFFDRLNRGVVWATVMDQVSSATNFTMVDGRAQFVKPTGKDKINLEVKRGDGTSYSAEPVMLVDCSGFDPWWFLSLIKGLPARIKKEADLRPGWQQLMGKALQLKGAPWDDFPPLHAPMLSSNLGPGYGSLMVLGAMADRVLHAHAGLINVS
ncbi:SidA/IucD/PvdA family monooxygenase [Paraburkholderia sp.]|uniref:SidA/IucD/PvdA family monooxygenase n=1 Tax=Paraburkholderia sp. TaxID=1926495 RepID=UPI003D6DB020